MRRQFWSNIWLSRTQADAMPFMRLYLQSSSSCGILKCSFWESNTDSTENWFQISWDLASKHLPETLTFTNFNEFPFMKPASWQLVTLVYNEACTHEPCHGKTCPNIFFFCHTKRRIGFWYDTDYKIPNSRRLFASYQASILKGFIWLKSGKAGCA